MRRRYAAALDDTWTDFSVYSISRKSISEKWAMRMSVFTFEIVRQGKAPVIAAVLRLSDERAIWCHAEALALRIQNPESAFIQVKNSEGEIVVRAGVTTALASIEKCSCVACPLKRELTRRVNRLWGSLKHEDYTSGAMPMATTRGSPSATRNGLT